MFVFIIFKEDASLSVVGKGDKDLTILTDFREREPIQMRWGTKPGKPKELYHGTIIKIIITHKINEEKRRQNTQTLPTRHTKTL